MYHMLPFKPWFCKNLQSKFSTICVTKINAIAHNMQTKYFRLSILSIPYFW